MKQSLSPMVFRFYRCLTFCLSGGGRLEMRGHGGGQGVPVAVHHRLCVWNCRAVSPASPGEHRAFVRMDFPFIFRNEQTLCLFPHHQEMDRKLPARSTSKEKKRALLPMTSLDDPPLGVQRGALRPQGLGPSNGAQSWQPPQASLVCTRMAYGDMTDPQSSERWNQSRVMLRGVVLPRFIYFSV